MFGILDLLLVLLINFFLTLPPHLNCSLYHVLTSRWSYHSSLFVSLWMLIIAHWEVCTALNFGHLFGTFLHCTIDLWEILLRALKDVLGLGQVHIVLWDSTKMDVICRLLQSQSMNLGILFNHESIVARISPLSCLFKVFFRFHLRCFVEGGRWLIFFRYNSDITSYRNCRWKLQWLVYFFKT